MPPNSTPTAEVIKETEVEQKADVKQKYEIIIRWKLSIILIWAHACALYAFYLIFSTAFLKTTVFGYLYGLWGGVGMTAGHHRLWSHRSYKARWPLRVFLALGAASAPQRCIYTWSRLHRIHHKYADTDGDPSNINRGLWFAHFAWLVYELHPVAKKHLKVLNVKDLRADPVVRLQERFYLPLVLIFCIVVPTIIPVWLWGETVTNAFYIAAMLRAVTVLNLTLSVNSFGHTYGYQPYDKGQEARDSYAMSIAVLGEGWHNYHHTFPWDYSTSEMGSYSLSFTRRFIELMAMVGLAYDLKVVTKEFICKKKKIAGDGSDLS